MIIIIMIHLYFIYLQIILKKYKYILIIKRIQFYILILINIYVL